MQSLLSYRNWSLLVVLPSIGLLTIAINYPMLVGLFSIANDLPFATCLVSIMYQIENSAFWQDMNIRYAIGLLISYFFGFVIQAINTTWWTVKSDFDKCAKVKAESNPEGLSDIVEFYRAKKLFTCSEKSLGCCFAIRQMYKIRSYLDSIDRMRLRVVCKALIPTPKKEIIVPPTAGEQGYAAFQLFLEAEDNKHIASYLEWEKFLASFYEYLVITLTLN